MDYASDALKILNNLKSTRQSEFSSEKISEEKIEIIKKTIIHTANTSNRQIYSIIILDQEDLPKLGNKKGSHAFVFCIDFTRLHQFAKYLGKEFDSDYLTQFMSGIVDISLLAQSTIIAARSLGIDTLITNEIYLETNIDVIERLNIPSEYCFPLLVVYLGCSTNKTADLKGRLPLDVVFHNGKYKKINESRCEEIINMYDDEERHIGINDSWKKLGYKHYLEWFFDKWSPVIGSRKNSELFMKIVKEKKLL